MNKNDLKAIKQIEKELNYTEIRLFGGYIKTKTEPQVTLHINDNYTLNKGGQVISLKLNDYKIKYLDRIISQLKNLNNLTSASSRLGFRVN